MVDVNFDPVQGEEVRVEGRPGIFRIKRVYQPGEKHPNPNVRTSEGSLGTVDLKQEQTGFDLPGIPWHRLVYVDEARPVRRVIEWRKKNSKGNSYPCYIVHYDVESGEDHDGNPSIFVRFLADRDYLYENGRLSEKKIAELNEFLDEVRRELIGLDLDRWIYVRAGEAQRELDVAS
ncbi:hypothetical protein [Terracidiphilus sp.]|jgi:hypothetical protein|uniref:hypothetical protein n=1 Tax=Terracidiphilus sp. TaxID=1964191 RepID=UPI003C1AD746